MYLITFTVVVVNKVTPSALDNTLQKLKNLFRRTECTFRSILSSNLRRFSRYFIHFINFQFRRFFIFITHIVLRIFNYFLFITFAEWIAIGFEGEKDRTLS